jgi:protein arginine N-methyltransferase 7
LLHRRVTAVEANRHMAALARRIIAANGLSGQITVINKLSTDVTLADLEPHGPADVLLSEILGTLMLGESALEYNADARDRGLVKPAGALVPSAGKQFVTLVESADIELITSVRGWGDLDLSGLNVLQDTASLVFTKQYGFRFSSVPHRVMAGRVTVAAVDFAEDCVGFLPKERRHRVQATKTGTIHAAMMSWEVYGDAGQTIVMSTDPEDTRDNFARDMQVELHRVNL